MLVYTQKNAMANIVPNPWLSISSLRHIAPCDEQYFIKCYGTVLNYEKWVNKIYPAASHTFSCLPDPFSGNPDSKVFCLNKNPGNPDPCFKNEPVFEAATIRNLQLLSPNCFWAETIPNKCGKLHEGVNWLRMRTKALETILNRQPNIFFIEYYPYHSTKGFTFPIDLPSYEFSNMLIEQAMEQNKLIVIMREKTNWLKRIPSLEGYDYLAFLKCAQGGYLTPKNIIWAKTTKQLSNMDIKKFF